MGSRFKPRKHESLKLSSHVFISKFLAETEMPPTLKTEETLRGQGPPTIQ